MGEDPSEVTTSKMRRERFPVTPNPSSDKTRLHLRRAHSSPPTTKAPRQSFAGPSKKRKKAKAVVIVDDEEDEDDMEEERIMEKKVKKPRFKSKSPISMADAFLEQAQLDDAHARELAKTNKLNGRINLKLNVKSGKHVFKLTVSKKISIMSWKCLDSKRSYIKEKL